MVEALERFAKEQTDALQRASATLTGETEGFLAFALHTCQQADLLDFLWQAMLRRLGTGGVPARLVVSECDLLLDLVEVPKAFLEQANKVWKERRLPDDLAGPILTKVETARQQLASLTDAVHKCRARFVIPPRISPSLEEVEQRVQRADEDRTWVPLRDVASGALQPRE